MTKKKYHLSNWKDYNTALEKRGSVEIWINPEILKHWYIKPNKTAKPKAGRPTKYSNVAIKSALTLKFLYRLPFRQTQGFLADLLRILRLKIRVPDYSTLCKRQKNIEIELVKKYKKIRKIYMLFDSSGLKIFGEGEWKVRQHGYSKRRTWTKIHIGVGVTATRKRIDVAEITKRDECDCLVFPRLLSQAKGKIEKAIGDGAYDTRGCYEAAQAKKAKLITPPRKGSKIQCIKGLNSPPIAERNKNVSYAYHNGIDKWKEKTHYHVRSLVENMFFRLKTTFGDRLAAHKFENQKIEGLLKCEILNRIGEFGEAKSYAVT
ncbi:MAG: IS5 family transposase [Gammaproteobacteria bacterium]|nr:IS5 family transposase [Gammaproteobacteria bacterium]